MTLHIPDKTLLEHWLDDAHVEYGLCNQCEGLHIPALQEVEGVVDSRLFVESYGLLLSTELEIRPMALLHVSADLGRLNMDFPTLKIFIDLVDDATPQLVLAGCLPVKEGVSREQFAHFFAVTVEATAQVAAECLHLDYLFAAADSAADRRPPSRSVH
jgi:hypothetical protein